MHLLRDIHLIILCAVLTLTVGCTNNGSHSFGRGGKSGEATGADTLYTEQKAMSIHRTEPERALVMIDSAVTVGNITPLRGAYLKAATQYGGIHNLPLARQMCLDLLEQNDAQADTATLQQTYLLLAGIEYTTGNHPAIIRYATEASRLAHVLGKPDDAGKAEGLIAQSLSQTGRTDEGIERLKNTIAELRKLDTFKGVTAVHDVSKKLGRILLDNKRFDDMVAVFTASLQYIDELGNHPDHFGGMEPGFDPSEFVDFARGQTLAYLTIAYSLKGDLAKARETEAAVFRTRWSQSMDCDKLMSAAYHHMGEFDRFEKAMRRFENSYPDTINPNVLICLEQRSEASKLQGRTADALDYLQRAYVIRDSLDRRNQRDQLAELATVYHLQEEQLARKQAESDARFFRWITVAIVIALVIALAFAVYFFYKRRETLRKNRLLYEQIMRLQAAEAKELSGEETAAEQEPANDETAESSRLYNQICHLMTDERLFVNPDLNRDDVARRLATNGNYIADAIREATDGQTFTQFVNRYRLRYASQQLTATDVPVEQIALDAGFNNRQTFNRLFREQYGMSPSDFRRASHES